MREAHCHHLRRYVPSTFPTSFAHAHYAHPQSGEPGERDDSGDAGVTHLSLETRLTQTRCARCGWELLWGSSRERSSTLCLANTRKHVLVLLATNPFLSCTRTRSPLVCWYRLALRWLACVWPSLLCDVHVIICECVLACVRVRVTAASWFSHREQEHEACSG
jgi:hypothetical protein